MSSVYIWEESISERGKRPVAGGAGMLELPKGGQCCWDKAREERRWQETKSEETHHVVQRQTDFFFLIEPNRFPTLGSSV